MMNLYVPITQVHPLQTQKFQPADSIIILAVQGQSLLKYDKFGEIRVFAQRKFIKLFFHIHRQIAHLHCTIKQR